MAKKRKAAKRQTMRKPAKTAASRRRKQADDSTFNTLMILGAIVIALAVMYLYVQNKKEAALLPDFGPALAALVAPLQAIAVQAPHPTTAAQAIAPAAGADTAQPQPPPESK
jgi:hypothetical protein